jgi:hypothetical protein
VYQPVPSSRLAALQLLVVVVVVMVVVVVCVAEQEVQYFWSACWWSCKLNEKSWGLLDTLGMGVGGVLETVCASY